MSWTTPAELRAQLVKLWERGLLLAALAGGDNPFPLRLTLRGPGSTELSERFDAVRGWIADLKAGAGGATGHGYRLVLREVRHRVIGANAVPAEAWVDILDDALALIGKRREADRFVKLVGETGARQPSLLAWLERRPLRALELADAWPRLLDVVGWLQAHPRPGIYLRQVDLPGVHTKFVEAHRGVLCDLLDAALPVDAVDAALGGAAHFAQRYGFRDKPVRIRFRLLDPSRALLPTGTDQDLTVTADTFARLDPAVSRVFMTENEVNFLAFPPLADSMVIFGAGYGFDMLARAGWLQTRTLHYWGDIDTHGFAILDQLRALFAHVESFLMDRETLLRHQPQWGAEPQPAARELPRLNADERALYDELRTNRFAITLRLEQEKIGFGWMMQALDALRAGVAAPRPRN